MTAAAPTLTPRLVVEGADRAIECYREVFGARLLERYATNEGQVVHAALAVGEAVFSITEENLGAGTRAPPRLGGSPVLFTLVVDDPDAVGAKLVAAGGEVLIPIEDRVYGHREGRLADPFGHLWILSKVIEELSPEEIEARLRS